MNLNEVDDNKIISMYRELNSCIFETECFGVGDLILFEKVAIQVKSRGLMLQ